MKAVAERVYAGNHVSFARRQKQIRLKPMLARVEVVVAAAHRKQFRVIAALHDHALLHHQNLVGAPNRRQPVGDHKRRPSLHQLIQPAWIIASDSESSELVASSRIRMRGSASSARAIESRCRWPPESFTPRSPTIVS